MLPIPILSIDDQIRFWGYVNRKDENDCWLWTGSFNRANKGGQPLFGVKRINFVASRISWRVHFNEDPGNLLVCHECDNPLCMNPNHLWLGTQSDNQKDCNSKGRRPSDNARKVEVWDLPKIHKLRIEGLTLQQIANQYRVAKSTIHRNL